MRFLYGPERTTFCCQGEWCVYVSEHPEEERVFVLTDDYLVEPGVYIPPEQLAWDGTSTEWGTR